jgi:polyphosphate glucokinase
MDAIEAMEAMVLPDHVYVGGGNAKRLDADKLGPNRTLVPNISGLLGGIALWDRSIGAQEAVPTPAKS